MKKTISKSSGKVAVTGDKRCLQQSANYPLSFGLAIAGLVSPRGAAPSVKPERVQTSIGDSWWYLVYDVLIYSISVVVGKGVFPQINFRG